jgi:hypothetical protein
MVDIFPSVPGCKYQDEGLFSTHLRGVDRSGLHSIAGEYNPMALDQLRAAMEWGDRANTERLPVVENQLREAVVAVAVTR